jgi:tRNA 2-thiouridine synthesizing protein C
MAMTAAAFDQQVSLLLLDDGVFLLKPNQQPETIGLKDIQAIVKALPLYDISPIYAESESIFERGLAESQLIDPIIPLARVDIGQLLNQFDVIFTA